VDFEGESDEEIIKAVKSLGFNIYEKGKEPNTATKKDYSALRIILCVIIMISAHVVMHFIENKFLSGIIQLALSLLTCIVCAPYFYRGIKGFLSLSPNMESLVITGVTASVLYSAFSIFYGGDYYFDGAIMIFTVVSLGKYIESRVKKKAFDSIGEFMKLIPDTAEVERGSGVYSIPVSEIKEGDIISYYDYIGGKQVVVTHRVIEIIDPDTVPGYVTQGDNEKYPDDIVKTRDTLHSVYKFRIPFLGKFIDFLKTPFGFIITLVIPLLSFIAWQAYKLILLFFKSKQAELEEQAEQLKNTQNAKSELSEEEKNAIIAEYLAKQKAQEKENDDAKNKNNKN
jgi:signal peptidase I